MLAPLGALVVAEPRALSHPGLYGLGGPERKEAGGRQDLPCVGPWQGKEAAPLTQPTLADGSQAPGPTGWVPAGFWWGWPEAHLALP